MKKKIMLLFSFIILSLIICSNNVKASFEASEAEDKADDKEFYVEITDTSLSYTTQNPAQICKREDNGYCRYYASTENLPEEFYIHVYLERVGLTKIDNIVIQTRGGINCDTEIYYDDDKYIDGFYINKSGNNSAHGWIKVKLNDVIMKNDSTEPGILIIIQSNKSDDDQLIVTFNRSIEMEEKKKEEYVTMVLNQAIGFVNRQYPDDYRAIINLDHNKDIFNNVLEENNPYVTGDEEMLYHLMIGNHVYSATKEDSNIKRGINLRISGDGGELDSSKSQCQRTTWSNSENKYYEISKEEKENIIAKIESIEELTPIDSSNGFKSSGETNKVEATSSFCSGKMWTYTARDIFKWRVGNEKSEDDKIYLITCLFAWVEIYQNGSSSPVEKYLVFSRNYVNLSGEITEGVLEEIKHSEEIAENFNPVLVFEYSALLGGERPKLNFFKDVLADIGEYRPEDKISSEDAEKIENKISIILTTITNIGMVIAVLMSAAIGIKYMLGSLEEKAEYKKDMIPYLTGAFMLFSIMGVVKVMMVIGNTINNII